MNWADLKDKLVITITINEIKSKMIPNLRIMIT